MSIIWYDKMLALSQIATPLNGVVCHSEMTKVIKEQLARALRDLHRTANLQKQQRRRRRRREKR